MDEVVPRTTLTQRRSEISAGSSAKRINKEKVNPDHGLSIDKSAAIRVVMWIVAILFIGIGSALLLTNVLTNNANTVEENPAAEMPESFPDSLPVAEEPTEPEPPVGETPAEPEVPVEEPATPTQPTTPNQVQSLAEFADTDRSLAAQSSGNNLVLTNFKFFVMNNVFNYQFYDLKTSNGEIDPAVNIKYDENNNTIIELTNISRDNVTLPNNKTSRTINNVRGIKGTETENAGNISTYKFLTTQRLESRVLIDKEARTMTVQFKLP